MGNCCAGEANQGEINIHAGGHGINTQPIKNLGDLFDDREILGLRGRDKIALIIRIQALFRGVLTRRKIKQRYGFVAKTMAGMGLYTGVINYDNERVQEIRANLGPFVYPEVTTSDGVKRNKKPQITL